MAFGYTLGVIVNDVDRIVSTIQQIEHAMRHASPATVDALRRNKTQLERILDFIMDLEILSAGTSLPALMTAHRKCLQECIDASYNDKKDYIGRTRSPI